MTQDILSDVLRSVRLRGVLYFYVSGSRDWAAEAPPSREIAAAVMPGSEHVMEYHVVISGTCWAAVVGRSASTLGDGRCRPFPARRPSRRFERSPGCGRRRTRPAISSDKQQRVPFILHLDAREVQRGDGCRRPLRHDAGMRFPGLRLAPLQSPDRVAAATDAYTGELSPGLDRATHAPGRGGIKEQATGRRCDARAPERDDVHRRRASLLGYASRGQPGLARRDYATVS